MKTLLVALFVLVSSIANAQPDPVNKAVVEHVKVDLEARGVKLTGDCGAFEITKRVAWHLRFEGAGLLSKTSGANCQGYKTDVVTYLVNGQLISVDILFAGGEVNTPQWNPFVEQNPAVHRAEAIDPGDDAPVVAPVVVPQPPAFDLHDILVRLDEINSKLDALKAQSDVNTEKVQQQIDQAIKNAEKSLKDAGGTSALAKIFSLGIKK